MMAPRQFASALAIVLATAGMSGCATSIPPLHSGFRAPASSLRIRNYNWQDVKVYLVSNGSMPIRIGTVTSMTTAVIPMRGQLASQASQGSLQFLIRPIGSTVSYTTHTIPVYSGSVTELTVENRLEHSTLRVRSR